MIKQYGSWLQAKSVLDNYLEPSVTMEKDGISKNMPDILGYPVVYTKRKSIKGFKSFITIINPIANSCYIVDFNAVVSSVNNSNLF
jgi:hypothetical protein